ncbi:MAG TPA: hypothetical protein PLX06_05500 [Fimbriimonadaceae bacterium]|nr:hypothetical protein [Fimbriimonadaceae bacterium]
MKSRSFFVLLICVTAASFGLSGCSGESEDKAAKIVANRKKGGYIRLVNLSDASARLMFGPRQLTQAEPGIGTPFSLYRPGTHKAQIMVGKPEKAVNVTLEIESDRATAIYLLDSAGKTAILHGDEVRASESASSVRLVNLTSSAAELDMGAIGVLTAEPGGGSESKPASAGAQSWKGKNGLVLEMAPTLEAGTAYVVVLYSKGGKTHHTMLESSRKQEIQAQGASPAG